MINVKPCCGGESETDGAPIRISGRRMLNNYAIEQSGRELGLCLCCVWLQEVGGGAGSRVECLWQTRVHQRSWKVFYWLQSSRCQQISSVLNLFRGVQGCLWPCLSDSESLGKRWYLRANTGGTLTVRHGWKFDVLFSFPLADVCVLRYVLLSRQSGCCG